MFRTINIAAHPSNNDKTAKLEWEDKARQMHAYSVKGGYVACPAFSKALDFTFASLADAKAALDRNNGSGAFA